MAGHVRLADRDGRIRRPGQGRCAGSRVRRPEGRGQPALDRGGPSGLAAVEAIRSPEPGRAADAGVRVEPDEAARRPGLARHGDPALAAYNDPGTPESILRRYESLSAAERDDAIATLASRPGWAMVLLDAIGKGTVSRRDLNTTVARQILAFQAPKLTSALEHAWGTIRPTARDKAPLIAKYKAILAARDSRPPDPDRGRAVFSRICTSATGSSIRVATSGRTSPVRIGPIRTTSWRTCWIPVQAVGKDYTLTTVATRDGRLVSGILRDQTPNALVIQSASERITLPRDDVEEIKGSNVSMMPEGQLDPLTAQEIRDLFAYLATSQQTAIPKGRAR